MPVNEVAKAGGLQFDRQSGKLTKLLPQKKKKGLRMSLSGYNLGSIQVQK